MSFFRQQSQKYQRHIQQRVGEFSIALYAISEAGDPSFDSTGFLLESKGRVVLLMAAHAVNERPPLLLPNEGPAVVLSSLPRSIDGGRNLLTDVAVAELTPAERARYGPWIIPSSHLRRRSPSYEFTRFVTFGYRARKQRFDPVAGKYMHTVFSLLAQEAPSKFYKGARHSPTESLLLGGKPSLFRGPNGVGGIPKIRGVSGAPVWRTEISRFAPNYNRPALVGMVVGAPEGSRKVFCALTAETIRDQLSQLAPGFLPES